MSRVDYQKAKQIFIKASELPKEKIEEFLFRECGNDDELLKEVQDLLKYKTESTIVNKNIQYFNPKAKENNSNQFSKPHSFDKIVTAMFSSRAKRSLAILVTLLLLIVTGMLVYSEINKAYNQMVYNDLYQAVETNSKALEIWIEDWKSDARLVAKNKKIKSAINQLVKISFENKRDNALLKKSKLHSEIAALLQPYFSEKGIFIYTVINELGTVVSSSELSTIGLKISPTGAAIHRRSFQGETNFIKPFLTGQMLSGYKFEGKPEPLVFVATPVYDKNGKIIASINLGSYTPQKFSDILSVAKIGKSGEAYAFDSEGYLLSESRYKSELKDLGILSKDESISAFKLQIRDPESNLLNGEEAKLDINARPLTRLAALAIADSKVQNNNKVNVVLAEYNNYVGLKVVGAYKWMSNYNFGIAAEVSSSEAYKTLYYLDLIFASIFFVLIISSGIGIFSSFSIVRLRKKIKEQNKVGKYKLIKQIGEGGLGQVFLAEHDLLKRPTAVKVLKPDLITEENVIRFEREVQASSKLVNPNTIEIYDFGYTDEGVFYYAMEYLNGFSVYDIVKIEGKLDEGRTAYILRQVCNSLNEAHLSGIIHRDIKPHNIMVVNRVDSVDFVKVLDFGLVKDLNIKEENQQTVMGKLSGTVLYMAPERFKVEGIVDNRSDIFSLGATAYFMLMGENAFDGESRTEILFNIVNNDKESIKKIEESGISLSFKNLILKCLAHSPNERYSDVSKIASDLDFILNEIEYSPDQYKDWWNSHQKSI